jgi:hypothetical protein
VHIEFGAAELLGETSEAERHAVTHENGLRR